MQTPPGSNLPNSRSPRDKDEWIAVVIALGVLGGTAGWIITNRSSALQADGVLTDLPAIGLLAEPSSDRTRVDDGGDDETLAASREGTDADGLDEQPSAVQRLFGDDETLSRLEEDASRAASTPTTSQTTDTDQSDAIAPNAEALGTEPSEAEPTEEQPAEEPETTDSVTVPEPTLPEDIAANGNPQIREPLVFSDLPEDHWGKPYIDTLTALGILNGLPDGTYAPDRPMTRAELAVQVAQAFAIDRGLPSETFTDIPTDYWAAATIDEAVTTGFMTGYPNNVFQPDQTVPRAQVLVTLATGLTLPEASAEVLQSYEDQSAIPAWARAKVAAAIDAGLIDTSPDTTSQLRPNEPATRAEVAAMLHSALVRLGRVEPIE